MVDRVQTANRLTWTFLTSVLKNSVGALNSNGRDEGESARETK